MVVDAGDFDAAVVGRSLEDGAEELAGGRGGRGRRRARVDVPGHEGVVQDEGADLGGEGGVGEDGVGGGHGGWWGGDEARGRWHWMQFAQLQR